MSISTEPTPIPSAPSDREMHYYTSTPEKNTGAFGVVKDAPGQCAVIADPARYLMALKVAQSLIGDSWLAGDQRRSNLQQGNTVSYVELCGPSMTYADRIAASRFMEQKLGGRAYKELPELPYNYTMSDMVIKEYKTDNPIFSDLILLSQIPSQSSLVVPSHEPPTQSILLKSRQKRMLEDLYGLKITITTDGTGAKASMSMRKFKPWVNHAAAADELLNLIEIFDLFQLTHSDVKPDNIMTDTQGTGRSWLVDLDNIIRQIVSGGFSCDSRFYRFRSSPTFEDRVLHDKALVLSIVKSGDADKTASGDGVKAEEKNSEEEFIRALTQSQSKPVAPPSDKTTIRARVFSSKLILDWTGASPSDWLCLLDKTAGAVATCAFNSPIRQQQTHAASGFCMLPLDSNVEFACLSTTKLEASFTAIPQPKSVLAVVKVVR